MAARIVPFAWGDSMPDSAQPEIGAEWSGSADGVELDSPSEFTCTVIQTANSSYLFLTTASAERRGLLVGGALGECPAWAIFVGVMPDKTGVCGHQACLRTGSRAVFDVASEGGYKCLVTSPVVRLVQMEVRSRESPASRH
jgi:hypothetical protein